MKVIPELPPQSPELPVMAERFHEPAPAPVMSCRSTLEAVTVQADRVYVVPFVDDWTRSLFVAELPASVRVPDSV